jgi:hypothetical protein
LGAIWQGSGIDGEGAVWPAAMPETSSSAASKIKLQVNVMPASPPPPVAPPRADKDAPVAAFNPIMVNIRLRPWPIPGGLACDLAHSSG